MPEPTNAQPLAEVEALRKALADALEQQTATSEILHVISSSANDVQPVFDAIVHAAVRLMHGDSGGLTRLDGQQLELAAFTGSDAVGDAALKASFPRSLEAERVHSA
jgi:two-component system, NtrC family, sensor kinase